MIFEELEKNLGYSFRDKTLLKKALTHPSTNLHLSHFSFNNEKLEFLGDAVLTCVITDYLLKIHPGETEGELTRRRAMLISRSTLGQLASGLGIGDYLLLSAGEENGGGRGNISNLENALEAIIGAIFLDSNFITVKNFICCLWDPLDRLWQKPPLDSRTELQEWTQNKFKNLPIYRLISQDADIFTLELEIPGQPILQIRGKSIKDGKSELALRMLKLVKDSV
jgi:ribonuclease III